jgi:hypothetical protein
LPRFLSGAKPVGEIRDSRFGHSPSR